MSRARSAARAFRRWRSIDSTSGCAPPRTRRAVGATSSSVVTASRRSSIVAAGSAQSADAFVQREWSRDAPFKWVHTKSLSVNANYPPPRDGLSPIAVYDVKLELPCLDAGGRACSLSTSAVSFIQLAAASLAKCSIQAVIDSFDINICAVGMLPRGSGRVDYVVAPDVEQAIRSKTMRLRPQHNTTPGRVEKYQSRGFTLLE